MEQLIITQQDKESIYKEILPQIESLICGEEDPVANLANTAAVLKEAFGFFWVGFYLVRAGKKCPEKFASGGLPSFQGRETRSNNGPEESAHGSFSTLTDKKPCSDNSAEELVLGPFQGPVACTRIKLGRGVCGTAWQQKKTLVVPDVDTFPGHIACNSRSRSEIVVPLISDDGNVLGVIDIDSDTLSTFDGIDALYLERVAKSICKKLK